MPKLKNYNELYNRIANILKSLDYKINTKDFPLIIKKYNDYNFCIKDMINQIKYVDINLDVILKRIKNATTIDDYKYLAGVFAKAAIKEHNIKFPDNPLCQIRFFCRDETKCYWLSKQAELGDFEAMYELCCYYLRRADFNAKDIEESLIYLGEKGIYKAYTELAHWFNGFKAMNMPMHFEKNLDKLKCYYLKAIEIVNKSNTLTEFDKIVKTIIINNYLEIHLEDDKYIEQNIKFSDEVYKKYKGEELITIAKLYIGGELGHRNNLEQANKFIKRYLKYNELTEEVNNIKEDIKKIKNKEMELFQQFSKYRIHL